MQRLRLKFGRGEEIKFISHLDVVRSWERILRRAGIPVAYSQGFTPRPRISVAAPLAIGITSEAELLDVWLSRWMPPQTFMMGVKSQLPLGFDIFDVWEAGLNFPSLQASLGFAEYRVEVNKDGLEQDVESSLHLLLQCKEFPWHHLRNDKVRSYDLRALIDDMWLIDYQDTLCILGMRLRCDASGSGRPEQVTAALGFSQRPRSIQRTRLILKTANLDV